MDNFEVDNYLVCEKSDNLARAAETSSNLRAFWARSCHDIARSVKHLKNINNNSLYYLCLFDTLSNSVVSNWISSLVTFVARVLSKLPHIHFRCLIFCLKSVRDAQHLSVK